MPVEGSWYAVPVGRGLFGLLIVTFFDGGHFAGFYFGPAASSIEELRHRPEVEPADAVLVAITEKSGVTSGRWTEVGRHTADVESWQLPAFVDTEGSTDEYLYTMEPRQYSWHKSRRRRPPDDHDHRRRQLGFYHHLLVENTLSRLLGTT
jgi:hypothetical protein